MFRTFLNSITKFFDLPAWFQQMSSTGIEAMHTRRPVVALVLVVGSLLRMHRIAWQLARNRTVLAQTACNMMHHRWDAKGTTCGGGTGAPSAKR